jgi:hypothetical protein
MKSATALKFLSAILFFFALGHTLGTADPRVQRGAPEAAVFAAMKAFRFPIMGFTRSHWDFYRGFAITITVLLLMLATIAWQLAGIAQRNPREVLPIALTLLAGCAALLIVGFEFFFWGPIVTSIVAVACATMVVIASRRAAPERD